MKRWIKGFWIQVGWLLKRLIIFAIVGAILCLIQPNTSESSARYILSAISQGLAAIMALAITIIMIIGQLTDLCFYIGVENSEELLQTPNYTE